jgi:hypothetical protein
VGKFSAQELTDLRTNDELLTKLVAKYGLEKSRRAARCGGGREGPRLLRRRPPGNGAREGSPPPGRRGIPPCPTDRSNAPYTFRRPFSCPPSRGSCRRAPTGWHRGGAAGGPLVQRLSAHAHAHLPARQFSWPGKAREIIPYRPQRTRRGAGRRRVGVAAVRTFTPLGRSYALQRCSMRRARTAAAGRPASSRR